MNDLGIEARNGKVQAAGATVDPIGRSVTEPDQVAEEITAIGQQAPGA